MAERIELPSQPAGKPEEQMQTMYNYLYRLAETLNLNLAEIGPAALTDEEQELMNQLATSQQTSQTAQAAPAGYDYQGQETLKSLIIKTATFVKTQLDAYRMVLYGETEGASQFGSYRQKKGLRVDVNPDGVKQTYSFAEIVKGLKTYEINAKNYIKTGYLRTENSLPVYGVAIGKDIVTFSENGTETYNDGNKVAELTADQLTFYQGGYKVASYNGSEIAFFQGNVKRVSITSSGMTIWNASGNKVAEFLTDSVKLYKNGTMRTQMDADGVKLYDGSTKLAEYKGSELGFYQGGNLSMKLTGNRIGFYNSGTEYMYITGGKIYASGDLELGSGKKVKAGNWTFDQSGIWILKSSNSKFEITDSQSTDYSTAGIEYTPYVLNHGIRLYGYDKTHNKTVSFPFIFQPDNGIVYAGDDGTNNQKTYYYGTKLLPQAKTGSTPTTTDWDNTIGNSGDYWDDAFITNVHYLYLTQQSSRDIKHDIQDIPEPGERLDRLRPVTFIYDADPKERRRYGLIYEETLPEMPEICTGDEEAKAINYVELIPMMLKEIQSLRARVKALEERN